jgi:hypothetical protein
LKIAGKGRGFMKKDLSIIAKELFPNLVQSTYEQLLNSYNSGREKSITPTFSFDEAVNKYTSPVLNVMENKDNWKIRGGVIFVDFKNFITLFDEFFPIYTTADGIPYMDIGAWNHANGEKIVSLLITKIFYLNYTGMDIQDISFISERLFSPEIIRIILRLSEQDKV